ncbi:Uncharacterised protein [Blautia luti]|uniref:Uncharacterized protein n=1 Tax=Blautia luti TaxID=89014 RepID=A0A564W6T3_9FIRM|nr:hypothetical protein [Blautia luti]VUX40535.1 Uncharacterised protein [Blautia luti]
MGFVELLKKRAKESVKTIVLPETEDIVKKIGRAVQQECRDRSRMPSSA